MSNPIVMPELERTEIEWSEASTATGPGLYIVQSNRVGNDDDRLWIPEAHVPAFIAAIQSVYAKR